MNPDDVVIPKEGMKRGSIRIVDKTGEEYVFPHVNVTDLVSKLPESGRVPVSAPTLTIINVTFAVLSIPLRVIAHIYVGDEEVWHE